MSRTRGSIRRRARIRHDQLQRVIDAVLSFVALIVLAPLVGVLALLVVILDGAPVFFRQSRVGRWGRPFTLFKFRSMRAGPGTLVTVNGDPRITPLGRLLRRSKLDELPQLWNVLRGDMSLVGPRPEVSRFVAEWPEAYARIGGLRPGLTDLASLALADEEQVLAVHAADAHFYEDRLLPRKIALARVYRRWRSVPLDVAILTATLLRIAGARELASSLVGRRLLARVHDEVPPSRRERRVAHGPAREHTGAAA
jgi:lipopolysaccharide/colanic/teichoic acid biosynthesis glycosyltransferase